MLDCRGRICTDRGFTLIELLVVALVIGVLVAIAIPTLVVAQTEAQDAPAKQLAGTAEVAIEAAALDAGGSYLAITPARLTQYEPTITTTKKNDDAYVSAVKTTATTYTLTVTSVATGNKFVLTRSPIGITARSCKIPKKTSGHGGCESITGTTGTW
jgi:prepilin-type N-terminal cleavage/methylation domain-containing protein